MNKTERYFIRTVAHIHRVQNNMLKVVTKFADTLKLSEEDCRILMFNVMKHDQSKFSSIQFKPYVELTEFYHRRKVLNESDYSYPSVEIAQSVELAVQDHYEKENHHPERMLGKAEKMSTHEIIEIVCDLQAMAQEFNEGTCRNYYENVWKKKQAVHFYDDFDWVLTTSIMDQVIKCFESEL